MPYRLPDLRVLHLQMCSKSLLLAALVATCLYAAAAQPSDVVDIAWRIPLTPEGLPPLTLEQGSTITFKWDGNTHNVAKAEVAGARALLASSPPAAGRNVLPRPAAQAGPLSAANRRKANRRVRRCQRLLEPQVSDPSGVFGRLPGDS